MTTSRMPVDGPHRIYVDATPSGITLDVSHFLHTILVALAHAADEDGPSVLADLTEIAALDHVAQGPDSHAGHERDERVSQLIDEIADGGLMHVYGPGVGRLRDRLAELATPRPVPAQCERGAA